MEDLKEKDSIYGMMGQNMKDLSKMD